MDRSRTHRRQALGLKALRSPQQWTMAIVCGWVVATSLAAPPGLTKSKAEILEEREGHQARLKALSATLEEKRAALKDLDNQERSLLGTMSELEQAIAEVLEERARARKRVDDLRAHMAAMKAEIEADEAEYAHIEQRLTRRVRALYVMGEGGAVRHLLGASSFEDLALRRKLIAKLAQSDARLVHEHARIRHEIAKKREALAVAVENAELIELELGQQAALLADTRKERQVAVQRIEQEKQLGSRRVDELAQQQAEIRALVAKLEQEAAAKGRVRKGRLARLKMPIEGKLLRGFGVEREESGAKLVSNGIHLRAKLGTPVGAPADGRVSYTGWMRGFGRIVILTHDGGIHTLLAHLNRTAVETGDDVIEGQTIGFVGDTESTEGPKLYLEVRRGGRPVNPQSYLR